MELAAAEYNQEMLNEEIQDIDSDQEDIAIAQHYQQMQSKKPAQIPGLTLGGLKHGMVNSSNEYRENTGNLPAKIGMSIPLN